MQTPVPRGAALALLLASFSAGPAAAMGFGNAAPVIDAVSASPDPLPADAIATIACSAHDDGSVQRLTVTVSGGSLPAGGIVQDLAIVAGASVTGSIAWTTPAPGSYTVSCSATDDGGAFGAGPATTVSAPLTVTTVAVTPVVIDAFTGPTAPVLVGARAAFHVAAHDPAGSPVTYAWSASAGALEVAGDSATLVAPDVAGPVTVTVTATAAGGASASASLSITVALVPYQGGFAAVAAGPRRLAAAGSRLYAVDGAGGFWILSARGEVIAAPALPDRALAVAAAPDAVFVSTVGGRVLRLDPASGKVQGAFDLGLSVGPVGLAYDAGRNLLWMAEREAGQLRALRRDGTTALVLKAAGASPLVNPGDVAVDAASGLVWTVLEGTYDGALAHAFTLDGAYVRSAVTTGSAPGQVTRPGGVAVDGKGRLYVSDFFSGTVQVLSAAGAPVGTLGSYGPGPGQLRQPAGVAVLPSGDVAVASLDTGRVERYGLLADLPVCAGDADCDGMPDAWEIAHRLNPFFAGDALLDPDGDGLTNLQEFLLGTDPRKADTDGDGWSDGAEVAAGFDPLDASDHRPVFTASNPADGGPGLVRISSTVSGASCSVHWKQVGGPPVKLAGADGATPSFVARASATYGLEGVATCGGVASPPVRVAAVVKNVAPRPDAGRTVVVRARRWASLDGAFSSDANGDAFSMRWDQSAGAPVVGRSRGGFLALDAWRPGVYGFELTATDRAGLAATEGVTVLAVDDDARAPTASATSPVLGRAGSAVILEGRADVARGRRAAFAWRQVAGPPADLSGAASATASFVPAQAGRYAFELAVADGAMRSPATRVEVFVAGGDAALPKPVAKAPPSIEVGQPFDLDGAGSTGASTYRWRQVSGPAAGLRDDDRAVASAVAFGAGSYVFELELEGDAGPGVPARVRVDAAQPGRALPIAVAEAPPQRHGERLLLDGRRSRGGRGLRYRWTQVAGPWVALDDPTSATARFEPTAAGTYAFELEVDDGTVRSAPARVEIAARGEERDDR
ncbi:MAG: PKD domain-containing protein [Anaeromyxobacteraceae bacterium]